MAEEFALLGHDIRSALSDMMAGLTLIEAERLAPHDREQLERVRATAESLVRYMELGLTTLLAQKVPQLDEATTEVAQLLQDLTRRWDRSVDKNPNALLIHCAANVPPFIRCNRTALDRILSNLISNAITYSGGKTVQIDVTYPADAQLCFAITDQGPGFPEHMDTRPDSGSALPAWQSREGHGLGLSIAKTLARQMDATLSFHTDNGRGGIATLLLPILVTQDMAHSLSEGTKALTGMTILVAEDSLPQLLLIANLLRRCGAVPMVVRDGIAAEQALATGHYDVALLDLEMPGRNGTEICQSYRPRAGKKPSKLVILTAHHQPDIHDAALAAGADLVLVKPITSALALAEALTKTMTDAPNVQNFRNGQSADFVRLLDMAGPKMATELLARYQEDLGAVQATLIAGLDARDWPRVASASHVLIALAGTAGMADLEQAARALNTAAQTGSPSGVLPPQDAVLDGLVALRTVIQQLAQER